MFDNSYYSSVFEHAHLLQISPVSLVEASAGKGTNIKILLLKYYSKIIISILVALPYYLSFTFCMYNTGKMANFMGSALAHKR